MSSMFHDSQDQNPKCVVYVWMYVYMWKISFAFDLERCFHSTSLKLGRTVVSIENWSCIGFRLIRLNEGGAGGYANSRIFRR